MQESTPDVIRYGCPDCGGQLRYGIEQNALVCERCGGKKSPNAVPEPDDRADSIPVVVYRCPQCGAEIVSGTHDATSFCSYCGSDVVLVQRLSAMKRPDRIVPFGITREKCEALLREHLKPHRLFMPHGLFRGDTLTHFRPVYIPFWSYRVSMEGPAQFIGVKTVGSWRETTKVHGELSCREEGILYDASVAFEDDTASRLLRYDLKKAVPFRGSYLSGIYAQAPDVDPWAYHSEAKACAMEACMDSLNAKYGSVSFVSGEEQSGLPPAEVEEELVLLPVWLLSQKQGDRVLYTAINGENGKVVCDVPVSTPKMFLASLLIAAFVFLQLFFVLTLKPDWIMIPTVFIALTANHLFATSYRKQVFRELREGEPDFGKMSPYDTGPAMAHMRAKYSLDAEGRVDRPARSGSGAKIGATLLCLVLNIIVRVFSLSVVTLIFVMFTAGLSEAEILPIAGVCLLIWLGVSLFNDLFLLARIPDRRRSILPIILYTLLSDVCGFAVVLMMMRMPEDLLYYTLEAAILCLTAVEMILVNRIHYRFATRPTPFFRGEEGAA